MTHDNARFTSAMIGFVSCIGFYIGMLNVGHSVVQYFNLSDSSITKCALATVFMSYALIFIMKKLSYEVLINKTLEKKVGFKTMTKDCSESINHQTDFIFTTQNVKDLEVSK